MALFSNFSALMLSYKSVCLDKMALNFLWREQMLGEVCKSVFIKNEIVDKLGFIYNVGLENNFIMLRWEVSLYKVKK